MYKGYPGTYIFTWYITRTRGTQRLAADVVGAGVFRLCRFVFLCVCVCFVFFLFSVIFLAVLFYVFFSFLFADLLLTDNREVF